MLDRNQVEFACEMFAKWSRHMESLDRRHNDVDIDHSALLRRLLLGKPMLEKPPPRSFSYPNYDLVEKDEVKITDLWEWEEKRILDPVTRVPLFVGTVVVVDQEAAYRWEDEEKKILVHVPTGLRYEYFEKEAYPIAVAEGKPEDYPYIGKFLRRIK